MKSALDTVALHYDHFFDVLPPAHLNFFLNLQVCHRSPDVLCVHRGYPGGDRPPDEHPDEVLIWGPPGFPESYEGDQVVVYGHHNDVVLDETGWPHLHVTNERAFGIDSIRHGVLTAMRFPDRAVFQSGRFLPDS